MSVERHGASSSIMTTPAGKNGWPTSNFAEGSPQTEEEQGALIDALQEWKTTHYKELISEQLCSTYIASCPYCS